MNWDDLRMFLAAARAGTLAGAAARLGVDATTVGRRIDRLAQALGTALLETGQTGQALTPAGQKLLAHAELAERAILSAGDALADDSAAHEGTVRLSLAEGFATWIVAPHIAQFQALHPGIQLEIVSTNRFLDPSKREADITIMLGRPARGPLIVRRLTDYDLGLYAARAYLAEQGTPAAPADLSAHRLIGYIPDFIYAEELRYLTDIGDGFEPALTSSSINVQHALTASSGGIGVLPHFIGRQDVQLTPVLADSVRIRRSFWLVVHRDVRRIARIAAVIDWLGALIGQSASLLTPPD